MGDGVAGARNITVPVAARAARFAGTVYGGQTEYGGPAGYLCSATLAAISSAALLHWASRFVGVLTGWAVRLGVGLSAAAWAKQVQPESKALIIGIFIGWFVLMFAQPLRLEHPEILERQ